MAKAEYAPDPDLSPFQDLVLSGIPLHGLRVVEYLDDDGDKAYSWALHGGMATDDALKLLAVVGYQVGAHAQRQYLNALDEED